MWGFIYQLTFILLFWSVDIIPLFGSSNIKTFINNIYNSSLCYFNFECSYNNLLYGTFFIIGYVITFIGLAFENADSSTIIIYIPTIQTPVVVAIFMTIGMWTNSTPLWAIISSVILIFISLVLWKHWENKNKQSLTIISRRMTVV
jgi:hypothetical protein